MNRLLDDRDTYGVILSNPTKQYRKDLEKLINREKILNTYEEKYLLPLACRIPVIYYSPKIHEDIVNPPGRPIISGIDLLTARLGEYIDICIFNLWYRKQVHS